MAKEAKNPALIMNVKAALRCSEIHCALQETVSTASKRKTLGPAFLLHVVVLSHMRSKPQALSNYIPVRSSTRIRGQLEQQKHDGGSSSSISSCSLGEPIKVLC